MVERFYFCCDFLFTAVKVLFTLRLAGALWKPKRERRIQYAVYVGTAIVLAGFNTYNSSMVSVLFSSLALEIAIIILSWISIMLYHCRYRDVFCLIFFFWTMLALADFYLQTLVYMVLDFMGRRSDVLQIADIPRGIYQLFWAILFLWATKPICQWGRQRRGEVMRSLKWVWFLILPLLVCMIYFQRIYVPLVSEALMFRWWLFLLGYLLLVVVLLAYLVLQRERESYQALQMRTEMLEKEYRILQQDYEERRILQHDLGKHIQAAREMVGAGREQDALGYLEAMDAELRKGRNQDLANHDLVNLVLNTKEREAETFGITVQYDVDDMSGLLLESMEIVALFSNILDNSIEANRALAEGTQRWIRLSCTRKGQMLVLIVSNARPGGKLMFEGEVPRTTKADKGNHGIGMRSIQQIVDRHEGHMKIETGVGIFGLTVYLKGFQGTIGGTNRAIGGRMVENPIKVCDNEKTK